MKSLIELIILLVIVILIVLSIWGELILEKAGSYILHADVDINRVKFIPYRFLFKLYGINIPKKNILVHSGKISFFPPRLEFYGLKYKDKILLGENCFLIDIARRKNWEINVLFKGAGLSKLDYGFKEGDVSGKVEGIYTKGNCDFYGILYMNKIVFSDSDINFLGINSSELEELIRVHNGSLELDFTYKGPISGLDEFYRYKPGKKTFGLIKKYLLDKVFK